MEIDLDMVIYVIKRGGAVMTTWYTAHVTMTEGTGGDAINPHKYFTGVGTAIARSPKRAVRLARQKAQHDLSVKTGGMGWIPIHELTILKRDGVIIAAIDPDLLYRVRQGRIGVRRERL
jgi:hypothetical protein